MKRFSTMIALCRPGGGSCRGHRPKRVRPGPSKLTQAEAAIQKAAAANKYAFVFFWKEKGAADGSGPERPGGGRRQIGRLGRRGGRRGHRPGREAAGGPLRHEPRPAADGAGDCPLRRDHQGAAARPLTRSQLRQAFVSPGTALCMKHLQAKKLVLLCVSPKAAQVQQVSLQQGVKDFTEDAGLRRQRRGGEPQCRRRRRGRVPEGPQG